MSAQQFVKTLEELELVRDKDTLFKSRTLLYNNRQPIIDLIRAAEPLAHFARMRKAKPMRGMDDSIYSIHVGTEWEAEITAADLNKLADALASFKDKP